MIYLKYIISSLCLYFQLIPGLSAEPCSNKFVAVMDGGSSGTRLHVFKFDETNQYPQLVEAFQLSSNLALSDFSKFRESWNLMRMMINDLTSNALNVIPEECWRKTPIYVQVTAGVRQMDMQMSNAILDHIKDVLLLSEFMFQPEFVQILSTNEEGVLAWITVNYLLNKLQPAAANNIQTVGVLNLGGGSTQVAFETTHPRLKDKSTKIKLFGREYQVYSAGYDHFGVDEIRLRYLDAQDCETPTCPIQTLHSPCLNPEIEELFRVGNREFVIEGTDIKSYDRYNVCFKKGASLIQSVTVIRKYYDEMQFVGISAYYYILNGAQTILRDSGNGLYETSIKDITSRASKLCQNPKVYNPSKPFDHFLCLDMSYVSALLRYGYGIQMEDKISVGLSINNIKLSWALGFAIKVLQ